MANELPPTRCKAVSTGAPPSQPSRVLSESCTATTAASEKAKAANRRLPALPCRSRHSTAKAATAATYSNMVRELTSPSVPARYKTSGRARAVCSLRPPHR